MERLEQLLRELQDINSAIGILDNEIYNQRNIGSRHHIRLLTKCAESWDLSEKARQIIEKEGMTYTDRFGSPRARPEVAIMRDAKISFCRILRDLDIDVNTPSESRPPALRSNRG